MDTLKTVMEIDLMKGLADLSINLYIIEIFSKN